VLSETSAGNTKHDKRDKIPNTHLRPSKATAVSNEPAWVCFSAIWGFFTGSSPGGPNQGFLHLSAPAQAN
jgi:hypothetical protein